MLLHEYKKEIECVIADTKSMLHLLLDHVGVPFPPPVTWVLSYAFPMSAWPGEYYFNPLCITFYFFFTHWGQCVGLVWRRKLYMMHFFYFLILFYNFLKKFYAFPFTLFLCILLGILAKHCNLIIPLTFEFLEIWIEL